MPTAAQIILDKALLPTHLDTQGIREQIAAEIRKRSLFSATTVQADYLAKMQRVLADVASGKINAATARQQLQQFLDATGYVPTDPAAIKDLSSNLRLDLIIKTQQDMAGNVARIQRETQEDRDQFPAWELVSFGFRRVPRTDWPQRWRDAGNACGWEGAVKSSFVARKDSPIWAALGSGAGGYRDAIGNPYPPFAFGSSMAWLPVDAARAQQLGLTTGGVQLADVTLSPGKQEIADALKRLGPGFTKDLFKELA